MQQQTLGIVAPVPKGEWTSLANYQKLNIVRRNGASYMATAANTDIQPGVDPGWESYWMLLNEDGQGEEGAPGPAGPGVPTGGLQGEVLVKSSNTNYDTDWVPQSQIAAGSAENDGDGNNIVATYETKSDATAKNTNLQNQITQNAQNIEQNAQIGSRNAKRLDSLEQRINPSPFVTDSTVAYQKDVPGNAVGAVEIQAIGGMTYRDTATNTLKNSPVTAVKSVGANLLLLDDKTLTIKSCTVVVNNGNVNITGTADSNGGRLTAIGTVTLEAGTYCFSGDTASFLSNNVDGSVVATGNGASFTLAAKTTLVFGYNFQSGVTYSKTFNVWINKGSTALPYAPYTESALPIPAAVQALDGYGQGINATYHNHIAWSEDGTEKTYNKMVYEFVLDGYTDEVYSINSAYSGTLYNCFTINLGAGKWLKAASVGVCNQCEITTSATILEEDAPYAYFGNVSIGQFFFKLPKATVPDVATLRTYLATNPVIVLYVATPEVTDISNLITSDNLLPVQGNGVLIFENANAQAVPSTVEFITAEATA